MHLFLFRGCSLGGTGTKPLLVKPRSVIHDLLIGFLGTLGSASLSSFSDSLSFSAILSASLFMDLIFFLLNLALVLSDAVVILSSKSPMQDCVLLASVFRLLNFLASLESLFHLRLSCLFIKGTLRGVPQDPASNSGSSCSHSGYQVDICGGGGGGGPSRGACFAEVSGPDVHYPEEKLVTQLFSIESNLSIYAL